MVVIIIRNMAGHGGCCRCRRHGVVGVIVSVDVVCGRSRCCHGMGVTVKLTWTWRRDGGIGGSLSSSWQGSTSCRRGMGLMSSSSWQGSTSCQRGMGLMSTLVQGSSSIWHGVIVQAMGYSPGPSLGLSRCWGCLLLVAGAETV